MLKIVCWNIGRTHQPLEELLAMDSDVALLQEVHPGGIDWLNDAGPNVAVSPYDPWLMRHPETGASTYDRWPQVVKLSQRIKVEWFRPVGPTLATRADEMAVSHIGAVAAAQVTPLDDNTGAPFLAVSMYARWLRPRPGAGPGPIYSDASAHSIINDLTAFIPHYDAQNPTHRILAAGDLNIDYDAGRGSDPFARRANTVFHRMDALGLEYLGPQYPNGRRAAPTPPHLPHDTANVVTYRNLQIDHVFASRGFHRSVRARALNGPDEWGSSDHCRILIEVGD